MVLVAVVGDVTVIVVDVVGNETKMATVLVVVVVIHTNKSFSFQSV